jgi:Fe-S cluster assembly iron-binding protein IscA
VLQITQSAADVIKQLAPGDAGLRFSHPGGGADAQALQLEITQTPSVDDRVVHADGAHVFLQPQAAETLDDMVLDVRQDDSGVRFALTQQPPPGLH